MAADALLHPQHALQPAPARHHHRQERGVGDCQGIRGQPRTHTTVEHTMSRVLDFRVTRREKTENFEVAHSYFKKLPHISHCM